MPSVGEGQTSSTKVSVYEAARRLGVTVDAVRKRIQRGTIPHERDEEGRVWVILDTEDKVLDGDWDTDQYLERGALISQMQARIDSLERQLAEEREASRENRRLLAAALERLPPQLEAPQEPTQEAPTEATEQPGRVGPQAAVESAQEDSERGSWWRRMLGG
jgi:excisionase family DNA binding protein